MSTKDRETVFHNAATTSQRRKARRWPSWAIVVVVLVLGIVVLGFLPLPLRRVESDVRERDMLEHASSAIRSRVPDDQTSARRRQIPAPGPARATKGDEDDIDEDWKKK